MHIVVPIKEVPDLVEELEVNAAGTDLEREYLKYRINEWDEQALEEALCLKDEAGATVTAVAVDTGDVDSYLYTALAKGADRAIKVTGSFSRGGDNHTVAAALAGVIGGLGADLVLGGVQAPDDLDGQIPVLLAAALGLPCVSVVSGVSVSGGTATVRQEYSGGLMAELDVTLPAVIGVQAARQAPRYAAVSRIRQLMKQVSLEEVAAEAGGQGAGLRIRRLYRPEAAGHAEMIEGSAEEQAQRLFDILAERKLVRR
ncbi:MAG TPA: electron transfer flavoprotein subunit beta/FixA family protein [Candidatus Dormibacteraeota bacterium]